MAEKTVERPAPATRPMARRDMRMVVLKFFRELTLVPVIVVLLIAGAFVNPVFFTTSNLINVAEGGAALGMVVSAVGLAGMTMLQAHTAYVWSALWLTVVGIGSGMFMSPNTAAMMGSVPENRRGIAAGARVMLQNTGAVISIAFVMAIITAAVPQDVLFKIFSGLTSGLSAAQLAPFISNMHLALWVLAAVSLVGAAVSMLRPVHVRTTERGTIVEVAA